jgi:hypothetical protein
MQADSNPLNKESAPVMEKPRRLTIFHTECALGHFDEEGNVAQKLEP